LPRWVGWLAGEPVLGFRHKLVRSLVRYIEKLADIAESQAMVMQATCGAAGQSGGLTLAGRSATGA